MILIIKETELKYFNNITNGDYENYKNQFIKENKRENWDFKEQAIAY
jgi:hypothetical protein